MDDKGFAYTIDAVLALIPIMIVFVAVIHITATPEPPSPIASSQNAQDTMELMTHYTDGSGMTVLESISYTLQEGNNSKDSIEKAGKIASSFLDKNSDENYLLTEENHLSGKALAGKLDLEHTENVATAVGNCGNYSFRLYME